MLHCNMPGDLTHAGRRPEFQPAAKKPARTRARIRDASIPAGTGPVVTAAEEQMMEEQKEQEEQARQEG